MKARHAIAILASAACAVVICRTSGAQGGGPPPSATEILRLVRYSQAAEEQDFVGSIRDRKIAIKAIPLKLTMSEKEVRFDFYAGDSSRNPIDQRILLSLLDNRYKIEEIRRGERADLAPERFAEKVRGTDITFEDLAMRFLYWPDPQHVGVEKAKGGEAWKIHCTNPVDDGAYKNVNVWVSQESGALVKMEGFNAKNQLVKSFEVDEVQRHKQAWILQKMIVRTHHPDGRVTRTYLEIEPPE